MTDEWNEAIEQAAKAIFNHFSALLSIEDARDMARTLAAAGILTRPASVQRAGGVEPNFRPVSYADEGPALSGHADYAPVTISNKTASAPQAPADEWMKEAAKEIHAVIREGGPQFTGLYIDNACIAGIIAKHAPDTRSLVSALEPFAKDADRYDPEEGDDHVVAYESDFTIGHLRRARAALLKARDCELESKATAMKRHKKALREIASREAGMSKLWVLRMASRKEGLTPHTAQLKALLSQMEVLGWLRQSSRGPVWYITDAGRAILKQNGVPNE